MFDFIDARVRGHGEISITRKLTENQTDNNCVCTFSPPSADDQIQALLRAT